MRDVRSEGPVREVVAGHRRIVVLQMVGTCAVITLARTKVSDDVGALYSTKGLPVSHAPPGVSPSQSLTSHLDGKAVGIYKAGVPQYNLENRRSLAMGDGQ
jgi:hypothetical protein